MLYQAEPRPDWAVSPIQDDRKGFEVTVSLTLDLRSLDSEQVLRGLQAGTAEALENALAEALHSITADHAIAWFAPAAMVYTTIEML